MTAVQPLCWLIGVNTKNLSKHECLLLEAELFRNICQELRDIFRNQYKEYFHFMKFSLEMENTMLDGNFVSLIIQDILSTNEYTLQGIACYTNTPPDIVEEIAIKRNVSPSAIFLQRIIELHRSVRLDLYNMIIKKIISDYCL